MRKIISNKSTKKSRTKKPKSYRQKVEAEKAAREDYVGEVPEISDEEVKKRIFPKTRVSVSGMTVTHDDSGLVSSEYGPMPLGFREIPPSMIPLSGPVGKAVKHFAARNFFLGDQVNGWFRQNCFVAKACNMPGDDAVSCGWKVKTRNGKKADEKIVQEMNDRFESEEFSLAETMREFESNKRCYGGAMMVPCFEEDVDMSVPFVDLGQLKGKTFLGWSNIEPYYVNPEFEPGSRELNDPTYKFYMCPTYWTVYGNIDGAQGVVKKIHRSWVFFRRNTVTSRIYQPMYKYLGPSVPQMIVERLYSAEVCANESSMLLRSKRTFVIEANIAKMALNQEYTEKFLKNCAGNADNWGVRLVPRNSNARQMDSYLSECMPLTTAQYGILCAEVEIPCPKFMMAQLTGFANSGNYEIKLYAQNVRKIVNDDLKRIVTKTYEIESACRGKFQKFDVEFGELDIPTVTEEAKILYEKARAEKFTAEADYIAENKNPIAKEEKV